MEERYHLLHSLLLHSDKIRKSDAGRKSKNLCDKKSILFTLVKNHYYYHVIVISLEEKNSLLFIIAKKSIVKNIFRIHI